MAKVSTYTEATRLTGDEKFLLVDDYDGTPVTKTIDSDNLARYVVTTAGATLTNHTPNNLTYEQWGTEEATVAQADCPPSAVVMAWLMGKMRAGAGTIAVGDRGKVKLEVSFDGGATWADFGISGEGGTYLPITTAAKDLMVNVVGRATGSVTGDIQVRAMVADVDQANDTTWLTGVITLLVHPQ